jgi:short subunit dehydrogenase-like uncharacterized protein
MSDTLLVYGSYGYTGRLVVDRAVERGLDPILAGRTAEAVERQAVARDLDHRVFSLAEPSVVADAVDGAGVDAVLNCAGPFARTADPLVDACLATGTDYLDVTGEIPVFEALAARDGDAEAAGVTLLPGVGFDVVPTDCLAAHLADRLPGATALSLGFQGLTDVSPGTAHTVVDSLDEGGAVRRDGRIEAVPLAHDVRTIDFGRGPRTATAVPWGDVSTAYHTTGIPNVAVYVPASERAVRLLRLADRLGWLLGSDPVQSLLHGLVDRFVEGPDGDTRRAGRTDVWGEATDGETTVVSRLETPETYAFTARSAVLAAERVLDGDAPDGFATPAGAFGPEFVLDVEGVERTDE